MVKKIKQINLSDHTLDINVRKYSYKQFDFKEIEDFVYELTGDRYYFQFDAIKQIMIYLWGGSYKSITNLAKENYNKPAIQQRFQSKDNFLRHLPLPDRLSGVVHMATGTGKSYVMFAIAYLSIILGKVKRVLVLGPPSTVIESGLTEKFRRFMYGREAKRLQEKLPLQYRNIPVNLLNENKPIEDYSIVIENINAIYNKERNSIGDSLLKNTDEILVLSDEVHHAYTHLNYTGTNYVIEESGKSEIRDERLWMKFIREEPKITRHIGFTGTPYNQDEYFVDVIYNYSIKDAIDDKVIKEINPILKTEFEDETKKLNNYQKFEQILDTHYKNKEKYSYPDRYGKPRLKPITIFINKTQASAKKNTEKFVNVLVEYLKNKFKEYSSLSSSELYTIAHQKAICVISNPADSDYQEKLDMIEEIDPEKTGGEVEFIFAVNKLSEGWDVDNVYQIVPMEERVFNSKLLISQVLGRGLRIPRDVSWGAIVSDWPVVTITNHEKFAEHIKELVDAVTKCETKFISTMLPRTNEETRGKNNFELFHIQYIPAIETVEITKKDTEKKERTFVLTPPADKLKMKVYYLKDEKKFQLTKAFYTIDQIAMDVAGRFKNRQFESLRFDFGEGMVINELPDFAIIKNVILKAMRKANFENNYLSDENRKQIDLFFNQFLPTGTKKAVRKNISGNIYPIKTDSMMASSVRSGEIDKHTTVFISEDWDNELDSENKFVIEDFIKRYKASPSKQVTFDFSGFEENDYIRELVPAKPVYVVNTSLFKTPHSLVILSHNPETQFVIHLIKNSQYIDSWIKSRDKGFYSVEYEFWKGGKDRTRRGFNPDFFIKIDVNDCINTILKDDPKTDIYSLRKYQDRGYRSIIRVVEIKSDDEQGNITNAKESAAKEHFKELNVKLKSINPIDLPEDARDSSDQYYHFDLLHPYMFPQWFRNLKRGAIDSPDIE